VTRQINAVGREFDTHRYADARAIITHLWWYPSRYPSRYLSNP
jgi:hypothetical protein